MDVYGEELRARLWMKVRVRENGCWEWVGAARGARGDLVGYGSIGVRGKCVLPHRLVWSWFNGEIPEDMCILHRCDNPVCVNPDHLFIGTRVDNAQDAISKGRNYTSVSTRLREEDGYVWCCACREFLPPSSFTRNKSSKSHGCYTYCKKCRSFRVQRNRFERRKTV